MQKINLPNTHSPEHPADVFYEVNQESTHTYEENIKNVNGKIMSITAAIRSQHSELSKYLDEMPITLPTKDDPKVTVENLNKYYDSLCLLLSTYNVEHPSK